MQRAILSTVFTSWQASWRRSQSRNKLIVRAFRINTSHARERKYLQHRNLRNLHNKWQQWIRLSLRDTIATLKNSTLQAQEHVENVLRSTTRTDVLRRMIRRWRSTAAESKRQQHRRALFAEKRRYMTLQATMRQWQWKVACSPLTKQHRLMQHLLNKLRQSVERHAFRLWERQAHKKTLFERDRIGAELFRRSEIRVMALAEEIRVERERRVVFSSWKIITTRKKYACECLQHILLRKQQWLIQNSWSIDTGEAASQKALPDISVRSVETASCLHKANSSSLAHRPGKTSRSDYRVAFSEVANNSRTTESPPAAFAPSCKASPNTGASHCAGPLEEMDFDSSAPAIPRPNKAGILKTARGERTAHSSREILVVAATMPRGPLCPLESFCRATSAICRRTNNRTHPALHASPPPKSLVVLARVDSSNEAEGVSAHENSEQDTAWISLVRFLSMGSMG
ncbi:hypothetical protein ON010_g10555 [Phytophthora cinnamomi]|nr:hypothetical protein ON010_g10555 [Phytophthora cinnamomi]